MYVRELVKEDLAVFKKLCREFYQAHATLRDYDDAITEKTFAHAVAGNENIYGYMLVDKDSDEPIGYALITSYWCNEEGGKVILLDELYISPVNQHKGYGRQFMQWLEDRYRGDAVAISLEVLNSNTHARALYEGDGFLEDGFLAYTKRI